VLAQQRRAAVLAGGGHALRRGRLGHRHGVVIVGLPGG
jgi:hypothetical protein